MFTTRVVHPCRCRRFFAHPGHGEAHRDVRRTRDGHGVVDLRRDLEVVQDPSLSRQRGDLSSKKSKQTNTTAAGQPASQPASQPANQSGVHQTSCIPTRQVGLCWYTSKASQQDSEQTSAQSARQQDSRRIIQQASKMNSQEGRLVSGHRPFICAGTHSNHPEIQQTKASLVSKTARQQTNETPKPARNSVASNHLRYSTAYLG